MLSRSQAALIFKCAYSQLMSALACENTRITQMILILDSDHKESRDKSGVLVFKVFYFCTSWCFCQRPL